MPTVPGLEGMSYPTYTIGGLYQGKNRQPVRQLSKDVQAVGQEVLAYARKQAKDPDYIPENTPVQVLGPLNNVHDER